MKVKDLIAQLQQYPEDWEAVISEDSEGNSFKRVDDVDNAAFERFDRYELDWVDTTKSEDLNAVVIYP